VGTPNVTCPSHVFLEQLSKDVSLLHCVQSYSNVCLTSLNEVCSIQLAQEPEMAKSQTLQFDSTYRVVATLCACVSFVQALSQAPGELAQQSVTLIDRSRVISLFEFLEPLCTNQWNALHPVLLNNFCLLYESCVGFSHATLALLRQYSALMALSTASMMKPSTKQTKSTDTAAWYSFTDSDDELPELSLNGAVQQSEASPLTTQNIDLLMALAAVEADLDDDVSVANAAKLDFSTADDSFAYLDDFGDDESAAQTTTDAVDMYAALDIPAFDVQDPFDGEFLHMNMTSDFQSFGDLLLS
jgi:hypothetical protein